MRSLEKSIAFYGLNEQPFGVTPDTRFLYLSASHREALASLMFAVEARRGFSALVAMPGMGKTTLLFQLLHEIKDHARSAFVFQPDCSPPEFMRSLLDDLGIPYENESMSSLQRSLNDALMSEMRAGKRFVLVVDEAQDLDNNMLERIRLLSNFETPTAKLIHIILVGQPQLAERLERPELTQLRQRVSAIHWLKPFSASEAAEYIQHRLRIAGCPDAGIFTPRALQVIARISDGIPRNVNNVCFLSLALGFAKQEKFIDVETVLEAAEDALPTSTPAQRQRPVFAPRPAEKPIDEPSIQFSSIRYERKSGGIGLLALGLLVLPLAAIFLLSNPQFNSSVADWIAGTPLQLDASTLARIPVLQPPAAPAIDEVPLASKPDAAPADAPSAAADKNARPRKERRIRVASYPRAAVHETRATFSHGPQRFRADRRQTLFELALVHYGKANWGIVDQICVANPNLRCPYEIIQPGQQIFLPDLSPKYPLLTAVGPSVTGYGARQ
ncbi:MAG TPA: AAA family ATPase [Verrucomicrobiae bacterium]|nr:AAA family ATPase [Verrucomicrobiae bacterium]